jgi:putative membrane protein
MVLNSLAGLPAFLVYFCLAGVLTAAYITPHDEFALLRANNPAAAISLGFSMIGFALPLTSSIGHSDGVADMVIWGVIALIVQVGVYYAAHIPCSDLSQRIAKGEMASAIWLGAVSVTAGMLNAASMSP